MSATSETGVGSQLVHSGIDLLTKEGGNVLLVYVYPAYYRRFGFSEKTGHAFISPYPPAYPLDWTEIMLNETSLTDTVIQFDCVSALSKQDLWQVKSRPITQQSLANRKMLVN